MEMPNKVEINEKTKTLTVYVDCQPYEFQNSDYFKSDNGKILLKHQSVMLLAELTNTKVGPPSLLSNYNPVIYVLARTAERDGVSYTGIGETNAKTLFSDIMKKNPATTADNRAYERAVLGVLGLYGFIYGSSEINYKDGENKTPPASKLKSEKDNKTEEVKAETKTEDGQEPESPADKKPDLPVWWNDTGYGVYPESEINPDTFIVTEGPFKGKNWTVRQLYEIQYKSCLFFAERNSLENASEDFKKQVYSCRKIIREMGLK